MKYWWIIALSLTVAIPAVVGAINYKKIPYPNRLVTWIFVISTVVEIIGTAMLTKGIHNTWLYLIYAMIESWVLLFVYQHWIEKKWIFPYVPLVVSIVAICEMTVSGGESGSVTITLTGIAVIFGSMMVVYNVYKGFELELFSYVMVVIYLFYYTTNLNYFAIVSSNAGDALYFIGTIHAYVNAFCNIAFGFCLWKLGTRPSQLAASS